MVLEGATGRRFLMDEVPLYMGTAAEPKGNTLTGFEDFDLNAAARIWLHVPSSLDSG